MLDKFARRGLGPKVYGFARSAFVKNVAVLMSGSVVSQVIVVAAAPILTRLYHPDAFGVLGLFVAGAQTLVITASWAYGGAIILAKDDKEAANVLMLAFSIVVLMTTLIGIIEARQS